MGLAAAIMFGMFPGYAPNLLALIETDRYQRSAGQWAARDIKIS
jgi:hypothetical protein